MSTIFGMFCGVVGFWYLHRYLKADFRGSVAFKPNHKQKPTTAKSSEKKSVSMKKALFITENTVKSKLAVKPDDFKRFDGIGPKIANLLENKGILSYQQLSEMDVKKLTNLLREAGIRMRQTDPAYWKKQAKLAVEGKWDEMKKLQQEHKSKRNGNFAKAA